MTLHFRAAAAADAAALAALFDREGSACFCRWWHFDGDKNAWLDRCAHRPEENRAELLADFASGTEEVRGVIARDGERVVGWMKLTPASAVPKLYAQRPYRGLPCFAAAAASADQRRDVFTVGCFLIDAELRRQGVARALLLEGIRIARAAGARAIEAFPRSAEGLPPEEMWTGHYGTLIRAGFAVVDDSTPYPVLRLSLLEPTA